MRTLNLIGRKLKSYGHWMGVLNLYNFIQCISIEFHFFQNPKGKDFCLKTPSVFPGVENGNFESFTFQLFHPDRKGCVEILGFHTMP